MIFSRFMFQHVMSSPRRAVRHSCRLLVLLLSIAMLTSAVAALPLEMLPTDQIKLVPQPKEVQLHEGGFRVGPATRILVEFGHQDEDRIAAETLAEEITDRSGLQLDIVGVKATSKTERSSIVLARLQDFWLRGD